MIAPSPRYRLVTGFVRSVQTVAACRRSPSFSLILSAFIKCSTALQKFLSSDSERKTNLDLSPIIVIRNLPKSACSEGGRVPGDDQQRLALLPQLDPLGHRRRRLRRLRHFRPRGQVRRGRHRDRGGRVRRVPVHDSLAPSSGDQIRATFDQIKNAFSFSLSSFPHAATFHSRIGLFDRYIFGRRTHSSARPHVVHVSHLKWAKLFDRNPQCRSASKYRFISAPFETAMNANVLSHFITKPEESRPLL